jgi:hypothetical protein
MPFCPRCRDEFQDWAKTCPDCRVALVAELPLEPAKSAKTEDEPILLASAPNEPEARMWAGILEDKGIPAMVRTYSSEMFRGFPPTGIPIQPSNLQFDVYVMQSDIERAREILGNTSRAEASTDRPQRRAASAKANEPLVTVATPSNAAEAAMLAEMLEENGIHCVDRSTPRRPRRTSRPCYEICVAESDAGRARELLRRIPDSTTAAELDDGQPAKKRRLITSAVGIIDIVCGIVCLSLGAGFWATGALSDADFSQTYARVAPIALAVIGILSIPAGVCILQRRNRWIALTGNSALALGFFPLGLLLLGPIVMYRDEFE